MEPIIFLTYSEVILIHESLINSYGGSHGLRDEGLLKSAIQMPESGFGNVYFHETLFDMASAYIFHLVKNHPFVDGNKRIGFACADIFLRLNGYRLLINEDEGYQLTIQITASSITKEKLAQIFEANSELV